jgi:hypothetical protein
MYTYLVASLPTLVLGEAPPFRGEEFLFRLQGVLDEDERAQAAAILEGRPVSGSAFADAWQARETQLRNAVARARAAARNLELRGSMRPHEGFDVGIAQMVTDAFGRSDPLERELELDRCRWHTAEDLARGEQNEVGYAGWRRGSATAPDVEVIRIRGRIADLQVFEDTTGLRVGDPSSSPARCSPSSSARAC